MGEEVSGYEVFGFATVLRGECCLFGLPLSAAVAESGGVGSLRVRGLDNQVAGQEAGGRERHFPRIFCL